LPRRGIRRGQTPCLAGGSLAALLRAGQLRDLFVAGLFTGLIPCGLVYGFAALAASSGTMLQGALVMTMFGLGTAPLMLLAGCAGQLLTVTFRRQLFRVAAGCLVATGLLSMARGFTALLSVAGEAAGCPLCP
jgi:sulfite exporter TauE/SafE